MQTHRRWRAPALPWREPGKKPLQRHLRALVNALADELFVVTGGYPKDQAPPVQLNQLGSRHHIPAHRGRRQVPYVDERTDRGLARRQLRLREAPHMAALPIVTSFAGAVQPVPLALTLLV